MVAADWISGAAIVDKSVGRVGCSRADGARNGACFVAWGAAATAGLLARAHCGIGGGGMCVTFRFLGADEGTGGCEGDELISCMCQCHARMGARPDSGRPSSME